MRGKSGLLGYAIDFAVQGGYGGCEVVACECAVCHQSQLEGIEMRSVGWLNVVEIVPQCHSERFVESHSLARDGVDGRLHLEQYAIAHRCEEVVHDFVPESVAAHIGHHGKVLYVGERAEIPVGEECCEGTGVHFKNHANFKVGILSQKLLNLSKISTLIGRKSRLVEGFYIAEKRAVWSDFFENKCHF